MMAHWFRPELRLTFYNSNKKINDLFYSDLIRGWEFESRASNYDVIGVCSYQFVFILSSITSIKINLDSSKA